MWWVLLGVGAVLVAAILIFNMMIQRRNAVDFAFASVDTHLKKRYDLIPNLVEVCRGYAEHERRVLTELTELRAKALQAAGDEVIRVNGAISGRLKTALAIAESYPELKASAQFDFLSRSLNEVEAQIAAARRAYNAAVLEFNNGCQMFPTNIVAAAMGLAVRRMFEITEAERQPVRISGA